MRIEALLNLTEQWLMEIDADRVTLDDLKVIPKFLSHLSRELEHSKHMSPEKLTTRKLVNTLQQLRVHGLQKYAAGQLSPRAEQPHKVDMTPGQHVAQGRGGAKDQQYLAYGFAGKQDRDFKVNERDLEFATAVADALSTVGYFDMETGKITNEDRISLIRDFLAASEESNPLSLLNVPNFRRAQRNFQEKKVKRVAEPDDSDDVTKATHRMDMNTFIFAMSVSHAQGRGKKAWENYINPDIIRRAQSTFEVDSNKQEAARNLASLGFLHEVEGRYLPNWEKLNSFKRTINDRIERVIDKGVKVRHTMGRMDRPGQRDRMSPREKNFIELQDLVRKHVPSELYAQAKRSAISKIKSAFSAEGIYPELRNAVTKYLQDLEGSDEFGTPESGLSGYIQKSVETIALKLVVSKLGSLLRKDAVPVDVRKDVGTLKANVSKYMRRKAQA